MFSADEGKYPLQVGGLRVWLGIMMTKMDLKPRSFILKVSVSTATRLSFKSNIMPSTYNEGDTNVVLDVVSKIFGHFPFCKLHYGLVLVNLLAIHIQGRF